MTTYTFTQAQLDDLLRRQRENCAISWENALLQPEPASFKDKVYAILNAPAPEIGQGEIVVGKVDIANKAPQGCLVCGNPNDDCNDL